MCSSRKNNEITEDAVMDSFLKLSHFLGISNRKSFLKQKSLPKYNSEGSRIGRSFTWIGEALNTLKQDFRSQFNEQEASYLEKLSNAFMRFSDQQYKVEVIFRYPKTEYMNFLKNNHIIENVIRKGEPFIMRAGWLGHAIGLAIIGNRLIVTNTGGGANEKGLTGQSGSAIYEIDPEKLTEENIACLMMFQESSDYLQKAIHHIVKKDSDTIIHPHKYQKVGNCGVSNPKKMMNELIACMKSIDVARKNGVDVMHISNNSIQEHLNQPETTLLFKKITGKDIENSNLHGMRGVAMQEWRELGIHIENQKVDIPIGIQTSYREMNVILNEQINLKQKRKEITIDEALMSIQFANRSTYMQFNTKDVLNELSQKSIKFLIEEENKHSRKSTANDNIDIFAHAVGLENESLKNIKEIYVFLSQENVNDSINNSVHKNLYADFLKWINKIRNHTPRQALENIIMFLGKYHREQVPNQILIIYEKLVDIYKKLTLAPSFSIAEEEEKPEILQNSNNTSPKLRP